MRRWHGRPCANPHACRGPAGPTTPQFTERNYVGMCASYPPGCARSRGVCAMCVMMEAGVGGWGGWGGGGCGVNACVCARARACVPAPAHTRRCAASPSPASSRRQKRRGGHGAQAGLCPPRQSRSTARAAARPHRRRRSGAIGGLGRTSKVHPAPLPPLPRRLDFKELGEL